MGGKPKGLSSREDALNSQQVNELMWSCHSILHKFIVYTLVLAGLRVSELAHLKRSWVNFEQGTITIPSRQYCSCKECNHINKKTGKTKSGIWRPKTVKGARVVLMHPVLLPVMSEFLANNDVIGKTRQRIWQIVQKLGKDAGIPHVYPHCLRATAATIMAYEGISGPSLQYDFGWARLSSAEAYVKSDMKRAHKETKEIYERAVTNLYKG